MESVVVTGAAQGIGFGIASRLLQEGYAVVLVDINGEALQSAVDSLSGAGALSSVVGDVAQRSTHEQAARVAQSLAPLSGWVNNAGYNIIAPIHEIDQETYDRGLSVVFGGVFWGTAVAVEHFLARGSGSIVNISSINALVAVPSFPLYAAAKGGIISLTRQVAGEYVAKGIRCNAVAPGLIATPEAEELLETAENRQSLISAWNALCPIGRWGRVDDISAAVSYLLSSESGFMTGQTMIIDGGATVLARGHP
jgi:NAD(P)-dependent dehydrogenase (short-subunit alcohol dehydrogenase family)